jgi:hypothetical protein
MKKQTEQKETQELKNTIKMSKGSVQMMKHDGLTLL